MTDDIIPGDTTAEAFAVQLRAVAKLSMAQRAEMSCQMSDNMRAILEAGVRQRHPHYDERTVQLATIRCMLGNELFRQVYPDVHVDPLNDEARKLLDGAERIAENKNWDVE